MEVLSSLAKPEVIGPSIGLLAVIGWAANRGLKAYFEHQERMEKIRMGVDPDYELSD